MGNDNMKMYDITSAPKVEVEHVLKSDRKELKYIEKILKSLNVNMDYFYMNANKIKFKTDNSVSGILKKCSYYDVFNNEIITSEEHYDDSITHELLHMSSCITKDTKTYTGYHQADFTNNIQIGTALNEGCTALFDLRYCGDYTPNKKEIEKGVYPLSKDIVSDLEITLGSETLLKAYFNADLKTVYQQLSNLMGYKRTMAFLYTFDALFYCSDSVSKFRPRMIHNFYPEILVYTAEAFYTKITDKYKAGTLSKEDYIMFLDLVKSILARQITILKIPITEDMSYAYSSIKKHYNKNYDERLKLNKTVK